MKLVSLKAINPPTAIVKSIKRTSNKNLSQPSNLKCM